MPFEITKVETTPNPRARKLIVEPAPGSIRSYFKPEDAKDDPLAQAIFAIEGVTNVLIHTGFISVSISKDQSWNPVLTKLRDALQSAQNL
jgi:hypothetical protein